MAQSFTVKKQNGSLIFNDCGGYEYRNPSTIWCVQEADKIYHWKDFKEICICTGDYENGETEYTYSKQNHYKNTVPDFNFHSWPQVGIHDYEELIQQIDIIGSKKAEIHKVGWIGAETNHMRRILREIGGSHEEMFDVIIMEWIRHNTSVVMNATAYLSIADLIKKYSVLIDVEGNGYSARVKYFLWSHRPLLLVDRPHKEFYYEYLKEWVHYIPVKRDLSDLVEKTKWCIDNYDEAYKIAENAYNFSRIYLTREACYKQWNTIITKIQ
jgi:hypothetical protein